MTRDLPIRPQFDAHRKRFVTAHHRAALARVEAAVLDRKWTRLRSLKLDRALVRYDAPSGGNAA